MRCFERSEFRRRIRALAGVLWVIALAGCTTTILSPEDSPCHLEVFGRGYTEQGDTLRLSLGYAERCACMAPFQYHLWDSLDCVYYAEELP